MHALRCALSLVSLVFGEVFFGGSASLHDLFLHFLAKCFFLYTGAGCLQHVNTSRGRGMEIEDPEAKHYHINTGPLSASNTKHY